MSEQDRVLLYLKENVNEWKDAHAIEMALSMHRPSVSVYLANLIKTNKSIEKKKEGRKAFYRYTESQQELPHETAEPTPIMPVGEADFGSEITQVNPPIAL